MKPSSSPAASLRRAGLHLGLLLPGPKTTAAASPPPPPCSERDARGAQGVWGALQAHPVGFRTEQSRSRRGEPWSMRPRSRKVTLPRWGKGSPGGQRGLSPSWGRCRWVWGGCGELAPRATAPEPRWIYGSAIGWARCCAPPGCRTVTGGPGGFPHTAALPPPLPNLPGAGPSAAVPKNGDPPDPPGGSASPRL